MSKETPKACCEDCGGMPVSVENIEADYINCPACNEHLIATLQNQVKELLDIARAVADGNFNQADLIEAARTAISNYNPKGKDDGNEERSEDRREEVEK